MILLVAAAATLALPPEPVPARHPIVQPGDACALLTEAQVAAAIEVKPQPGKHATASSTRNCMWTDADQASGDHRRVTVSYSAPTSFDIGKKMSHPAAEPVSVGDEAYYLFYGTDSPAIVIKKGASVVTIRILNGLKLKAIELDALKAKELDLAKAAAAKL